MTRRAAALAALACTGLAWGAACAEEGGGPSRFAEDLLAAGLRCELPDRLPLSPSLEHAVSADWASMPLDCTLAGDTPRPAAPLFVVDDSVPPGFETLDERRSLWVDVVFEGRTRGTTPVTADGGEIVFESPEEVVSMLEAIADPDALRALLSAPLPDNAERGCSRAGDRPGCGRVDPDPVAVILDENTLRVGLFVAPRLRSTAEADAAHYLAAPERRPSSLLSLRSVASDVPGAEPSLSLSGRLLAAYGRAHLSVTGDYASDENEARLRELTLSHHAAGYALTAGHRLWTPHDAWVGLSLLGAGFSSSLSTRLDLQRAFGSELVLFLTQRSVVQLIVDGRIYAGDSYAPGNRTIDTRSLPDGTYPVEVRVIGADGSRRSEFRTFTRSARLPPRGEPLFELVAGASRDEEATGPGEDDVLVAGFSLADRIGQRAAWRAGAMRLDAHDIAHAGLTYLGERLSLQGTFALGAERTAAANLLAGWRLDGNAVNLGYRDFSSEIEREGRSADSLYPPDGAQWSLSASRRLGRYLLSGSAVRTRSSLAEAPLRDTTGYALSLRRLLLPGGGLRAVARAGVRREEADSIVSLGIDVYFDRGSARGSVGMDALGEAGDTELGLNASVERAVRGEHLDWGAGAFARTGGRDSAGARLWAEHRAFRASASSQLSRDADGSLARSDIAAVSTHLALDADGATFGGASSSAAGVVLAVDGAPAGAPFDVLVDERLVASGEIGTTRFIDLPPFRAYTLELLARGKRAIAFGEAVHEFVLHPGNVHRIDIVAEPEILLIGTLVDETGALLGGATIETGDNPQRSDAAGIVQLQAVIGRQLSVRTADERRCTLRVPTPDEPTELLVAEEPLVCAAGAPPHERGAHQ